MLAETARRFFAVQGIGPCRVLTALSGGGDSTALLLTLAELRGDGFDVIAGHVNHHLRGADSDADEAYVFDLCQRLGIDLRVADGTLPAAVIRRSGIEGAAREVRFARLHDLRARASALYVVTAHHRNDQAETVLMRLMTGTGISGLRAIHPVRADGVIRPFLDLQRSAIEDFLRAREIIARHDQMNDDARFLRTRVRRLLADAGPEAVDRIAALAGEAQAIWPRLEQQLDIAEDVEAGSESTLFRSLPASEALRAALLRRHITRLGGSARDVGAKRLAQLAGTMETLRATSVTASLTLRRTPEGVLLARRQPPVQQYELALVPGIARQIPDDEFELVLEPVDHRHPEDPFQTIQMPPGAEFHLTVRNRRAGDRFRPLGMRGTKKLKDFLIDRKVPRQSRDHIPLIVCGGEIACVVGLAIAEPFRVQAGPGQRYAVRRKRVLRTEY